MLSGKVIDFITRNKKCCLCDLGRSKDDHDCRLEFYGSAKAIEAAADIGYNSSSLKKINAQIGIFIVLAFVLFAQKVIILSLSIPI